MRTGCDHQCVIGGLESAFQKARKAGNRSPKLIERLVRFSKTSAVDQFDVGRLRSASRNAGFGILVESAFEPMPFKLKIK